MGLKDWLKNNIIDLGDSGAPGGPPDPMADEPLGPAAKPPGAAPARPGAPAPGVPGVVKRPAPDAGALRPAKNTLGDLAASVPKPVLQAAPPAIDPNRKVVPLEQVYKAAGIATPAHGYTIDRVAELLASERLAKMDAESKATAVLVALDAAKVDLKEVLQDAIRRDKALDAFDEFQEKRLADLRKKKEDENRSIEEEIRKLVEQRRAQVELNRKNLREIEADLLSWKDVKLREEERLAAVVAHFVTDNPITVSRPVTVLASGAADAADADVADPAAPEAPPGPDPTAPPPPAAPGPAA